jgi:hypothetical protein
MLMRLLYGSIALFFFFYLLRGLLMAGYEQLNLKNDKRKRDLILRGWAGKLLTLKPLSQFKLSPKSIDYKKHLRFQKQSAFYYYVIWACLFIILFLCARIFLDAF